MVQIKHFSVEKKEEIKKWVKEVTKKDIEPISLKNYNNEFYGLEYQYQNRTIEAILFVNDTKALLMKIARDLLSASFHKNLKKMKEGINK